MKSLFIKTSIFVLGVLSNLNAETLAEQSQPYHKLFQEHFIHSGANGNHLYQLAQCVLENEKKEITPLELLVMYESVLKREEVADLFAQVYEEEFQNTDLSELYEFIRSDSYRKFNKSLLEANQKCLAKSFDLLSDLAKKVPSIDEAVIKEPKASVKDSVSITSLNYERVLQDNKFIVVDVFANWCGPCRRFLPIYQEMTQEYGDRILFARINASHEKELMKKLNIQGLPTVIYIKDGKEVGRHVGFINKAGFKEELDKLF